MDQLNNVGPFEPTVLGAVWRYRWVVGLIAVGFAALGFLYGSRNETWTATASLVVEDPRTESIFNEGGLRSPERYAEDQAAILRSPIVAQRASEIAAVADPPVTLGVKKIVSGSSVQTRSSSNLITVSFGDPEPEVAVIMANAVAVGYREIRGEAAASSFDEALQQLEASIARSTNDLEVLQSRIAQLLEGDAVRQELDDQLSEALLLLTDLQERRESLAGEQLDELRGQLGDLLQQIETMREIQAIEREDPLLSALFTEQAEAIRRLSDLTTRRDQLRVDAALASTGVAFLTPAERVSRSSTAVPVVIFGGLGVFAGSGAAYMLARRRRTFGSRAEPEMVVAAPLLAEVPNFREERLKSNLPVSTAPASASAEAFRFAITTMNAQVEVPARPGELGSSAPEFSGTGAGSVIVISANLGDGKSVVAANIALAAAREGDRVLAIDSDFGNQQLLQTLMPSGGFSFTQTSWGLTEVASGQIDLGSAVNVVEVEDGGSIQLLGRGHGQVTAPEFFNSESARAFFHDVTSDYDLVVIDSPPLLHVAYTSTLVRYADRAIVVVPHGSSVSTLEEVRDRLDLIGTPVIGYVYNGAPLRREVAVSKGSLADVLGRSAASPLDRGR